MGIVGEVFSVVVWILFALGAFTLLYEVSPVVWGYFTKKKFHDDKVEQWSVDRMNAVDRLEKEAKEAIEDKKRQQREKREREAAEAEEQRQIQLIAELARVDLLQETKQKALERNNKRREFSMQQRKSKRQNKEEELAHKIRELSDQLHDEPSADAVKKKLAIQLRFRLPNGEHITRNFEKTEKLEQLFFFIEIKFPFLITNKYALISYPRAVHSDANETLKSCGIQQSMSLMVELV